LGSRLPPATGAAGTASNSPVTTNRPGCYCAIYNVKLTAGTTDTIDLRGTDFDAYLYLANDAGLILAQDDDSGGGLDARIVFTAGYTGNYQPRRCSNSYSVLALGGPGPLKSSDCC
jgi:hypothetical protein